MTAKLSLAIILYIALRNIQYTIANSNCPRVENVPNRTCLKRCETDEDCVSKKKKCLCDGDCGMSCVNKNIRCKNINLKITNGKADIFPFNQFGAVAKYSCADSYQLVGISLRVCQGDETWSGEEPKCIINGSIDAGCPLLPQIDNGRVEITPPSMIGSTARYTCHRGYHLAGRDTRKCRPDGTWDGKEPSCERVVCSEPPTVPNAYHNAPKQQVKFPAGTELMYTCYDPYTANGYVRAMCKGDGTWSGPRMACNKADITAQPPPPLCGSPGEVTNGGRKGQIFRHPAVVTYYCHEGYQLIGNPRRQCQADGKWSGSLPLCRPVRCPQLEIPFQGMKSGSGNSYNSIVKFSCKEGYKIVGSAERRCMANGQWSGQAPRCEASTDPSSTSEEITCGIPGPLYNGYLDGHRQTVGAVFFFRCNVRTTFDGPSFSTQCQENGAWSHPPPKCWGQCQVPSIVNGTVMHSREGIWVDHDTFINYRCREGLVLNDTNDIKCDNGSWTLIPRCIPEKHWSITPVTTPAQTTATVNLLPPGKDRDAPCSAQPPTIENGRRVYIGWKHGDRAKYKCFQGFRLRGDLYMTCRYGRWVGSRPYCEEVYCPNPGKLPNGKIHKRGQVGKFEFKSYIVTIRHGDRLLYECDRGFELDGASGATCVDGEWSPIEKPTCKRGQHPILHKLWKPLEEQGHANHYYF